MSLLGAAAGRAAGGQCHRRAARGALPSPRWLGKRSRDRRIRRGTGNQSTADEPHSIHTDRDESATDSRELRDNCAPPVVRLKIPAAKSFGHPKKRVASLIALSFPGIQHGLTVSLPFNLK